MFLDKDLVTCFLHEETQKKGIYIIGEHVKTNKFITYQEVLERSLRLGKQLEKMGAEKGNEVIIQCQLPENFIYSFWACLLCEFVAVPVDAISSQYKDIMKQNFISILKNPIIITDNENMASQEKAKVLLLNSEVLNNGEMYEIAKTNPDLDKIIYIQFSSGSTAQPRGVVMRKSNIYADALGIAQRQKLSRDDRILTWQPLTHCYGLIVFHIIPIMLGIDQYIIPTEQFMRTPLLWLDAASQLRITRLGTIPFALKHFIDIYKKSERSDMWDLSKVKSILIGAEQISKLLCDTFIQYMKPHNLHENVIMPLYGLAETVTIASLHEFQTPIIEHKIERNNLEIGQQIHYLGENEEGISFLEIGKPVSTAQIAIMDDDNNSLGESVIGHICVKGEIVTTGYYKNEEDTKLVLSQDGWLDTGDIGFLNSGKLTIIGRKKELIVVNGKKYSCIDMENVIITNVNTEGFGKIVVCSVFQEKIEQTIAFVEMGQSDNKLNTEERISQLSTEIQNVIYDVFDITIYKVVLVKEIPRTYSGKIKRVELMKDYMNRKFEFITDKSGVKNPITSAETYDKLQEKIQKSLIDILSKNFNIKVTDIYAPFKEFGIISVNIPFFAKRINEVMGLDLKATVFFNYPNIRMLADYICECLVDKKKEEVSMDLNMSKRENNEKIAIVGMSCRFPGGANSISEFWDVLMKGKDGICDVPESRWELEKYYDEDENAPGKMYCRKGGFLNVPIDEFDAGFFNISPKEATALDPQQRLVLELVWEAFENAQIPIKKYAHTDAGVFLGISTDEYALAHIYSGELSRIDAYSLTGMCKSTACGRISYTFGFEGPCVAVDTACSSTLTAMHIACNAIKEGETGLAVVAGINLIVSPATNIGFSKLRATSKDGHSKSFDESANGYGRGEGGGVLILKRLSDAIRDEDNILGVVCSTAINQDGQSNGLTAPNGRSQASLIEHALKKADLRPEDVDYIEMHGTGTKLGDPIEVNAILDTYGKGRSKENCLKIGSVKSNIGHLEAGAGIASIIKVLLSMKNEKIPGNLHFNNPNSMIDWDAAPIKVIGEHTEWKRKGGKRRAGINGFGFGGSNAHVILEEYIPEEKTAAETKGVDYILKVSAKSEKSLQNQIRNYYDCLLNVEENEFMDFLYAANRTRMDFDYRFTVEGSSQEELVKRMEKYLNDEMAVGVKTNIDEKPVKKDKKIVFMFTGQGSQYVNMGKTLFETNQVFHDAMVECNALFEPYTLKSLIKLIYSEKADEKVIARTVYAQPLIFMIEYSLAKMWESMGVKPDAVIGHSIGEYAAAVVAGSITLPDAVKLVSARGRLMDSAPGEGTMGTIFANEAVVEELIADYKETVSIAAINAEGTCVISGHAADVRTILETAKEKGMRTKELQVSHGFHSVLMNPILEDFDDLAQNIEFKKPEISFISALYAREIGENDVFDHTYWTSHIAQKVDFYKAMQSLGNPEDYVFLEIGANTVLSAICKMIFGSEAVIAGSLSMKKDDKKQLAECVATLYVNGVSINWDQVVFTGTLTGKPVWLPTYAFDRNKFWLEPLYDRSGNITVNQEQYDPLLGQRIESPVMGDAVIMQRRFTANEPYFMSEHIIFEEAISPAAAHISMLLSTAKNLKHPKSVCIKEMELRNPLTVQEGDERTVQVCIQDNSQEESVFRIVSQSCEEDDNEWVTHTKGRIAPGTEYFSTDIQFNKEQLESTPFDDDTDEILYGSMHSTGFNLGEGFRRVTKNYNDNGDGLCVIEPLKTIPGLEHYELYPGVIDSLLQTMLCIQYKDQKQKGIQKNEKTIIPYFIGKITYNYKESDKLWCYVKINNEDDILYGEVTAFNEQGEVIIEIKDFMAKFTTKDVLLRAQKKQAKRYSYFSDWEIAKLPESSADNAKTQYVFVSDDMDTMEKLEECMNMQEETVKILLSDENGLEEKLETLSTENPIKLIFCPKNAKGMEVKEAKNLGELQLKSFVAFIRALDKSNIKAKCKLKILTEDTQKINENDEINLAGSMIWGFSKVFSLEYTSLFDGIVDRNAQVPMDQICEELKHSSSIEVCLHDDKRYVAKLVKYADQIKKHGKSTEQITVKEDGSYLITGGNGAVGLTYAESLVEAGAKNILLMSRKGLSHAAQERAQKIEEKGGKITILTGNVTDCESFRNAVESIPEELLPVHGVIHAAGTLKDGMISEASWEDYQFVMNPKVTGSVNISNVMELEQMDFFLMISSITSIVGNMGQSNYAVSNYFMNQFAIYLQKQGVNAYSVCWGPWNGGGMANDSTVTTNISSMGMSNIEIADGKEFIKAFMEEPYVNVLVADVNWKTLNDNISNKGKAEFLSKLLQAEKAVQSGKADEFSKNFANELKKMSPEEMETAILEEMTKRCSSIMGFENKELFDVDKAFREQGADSLMLFSIRTALNKLLDIEIDISVLYNYSTLRSLTEYLIQTELAVNVQEVEEPSDLKENTDKLLNELEALID